MLTPYDSRVLTSTDYDPVDYELGLAYAGKTNNAPCAEATMAVTPIDLYTITESGHRHIRPDTHDIKSCLLTNDYLIDEIAITGSDVFGKIHHPESPIIVFPAQYFVQLYWKEANEAEVHRTILGGSPEASCFGGMHIEPSTVYAIRNIMANEVQIRRYRPWQPQGNKLKTVSSKINISH